MKEVLKLALEALESSQRFVEASANAKLRPGWGEQLDIAEAAITAIKAALAQPAQEPVAWLDEEKKIIYWHNTHETDDYHGFRRTTPLYTTPQQRPWVGLTDEDHMQFAISQFGWDELIGAVEAKLKEKNNG
jgi:hypothetical protein